MKHKETWLDKRWRPLMGWTYITICIFDFIVAPILNYVFFGKLGLDFVSWKPLTMSDGGVFHISMGAILGVTAWQRGKEKIHRFSYEQENEYIDRADFRDQRLRNSYRED